MQTRTHRLLAFGLALGAGMLTRRTLEYAWRARTGRDAPKDPSQARVAWPEALLWGAAVGMLTGISRTLARGAVPTAPASVTRRAGQRLRRLGRSTRTRQRLG